MSQGISFFYVFIYTMMSDSKKTDLENFLIIIVFIQACYYHKFKLSSSSCKYPSRNIFPNIQEMCMVIRKIENICKVKIRNQNSTNLFWWIHCTICRSQQRRKFLKTIIRINLVATHFLQACLIPVEQILKILLQTQKLRKQLFSMQLTI